MTSDERLLLSNFLRDLEQARTGPKDAEAYGMISRALTNNPDAAYVLVQHSILADQALHTAQARIAELEAQQQGSGGGGFLGGRGAPWGQAQSAPPPQTAVPPSYTPQGYGQPQASPFSTGGGLGSFLRQAGTMAAGVAGGEMLFSGLSGLFGGHHGYGGFGGGFGGGYGGGPEVIENVTINEYDDGGAYDDLGGSDWSDDT